MSASRCGAHPLHKDHYCHLSTPPSRRYHAAATTAGRTRYLGSRAQTAPALVTGRTPTTHVPNCRSVGIQHMVLDVCNRIQEVLTNLEILQMRPQMHSQQA